MQLINLKRYTPQAMPQGDQVQYFIDEQGADWFDSLRLFKKAWKLAIDIETGVIVSITDDVSMLYPVGRSVVDVDTLPAGCDTSGAWAFDGTNVVPYVAPAPVVLLKNQQTYQSKLLKATVAITALEVAVERNVATSEQTDLLSQLKDYVIKLLNLNLTKNNLKWPVNPDSQ